MMRRHFLILPSLLALLLVSPLPLRAWSWQGSGFRPMPLVSGLHPVPLETRRDLDSDGLPEDLVLTGGRLFIQSEEQVRWSSPLAWDVRQCQIADLNHDGLPEAVLLVWRPFRPWPVDTWLPSGGRIAEFQDSQGLSAHIILIGWLGRTFGELWAGSALAEPPQALAVADFDGRGEMLLTLEGEYNDGPTTPARRLKLWQWNGFGFGLVSALDGPFRQMAVLQAGNTPVLVLIP